MQDQDKTRDQLIDELNELRRSFAELEVVQNPLTENESRYRQIIDKSNEAIFVQRRTGPVRKREIFRNRWIFDRGHLIF